MAMVNLETQRKYGGIALAALSAITLFPTQVATIADMQLGSMSIPIIGTLTLGKAIAIVGAFFATNLLMK